MEKIWQRVLWTVVFSIAMALLETAVVVYLRELYYPDGFKFPFKIIPFDIYFVDLLREAATLVMLISIAALAGSNRLQKLGFFLFCFGVWDIFYYIWLKVLLNWPESLFTWDILFLIPVVWVAPVLAPVINSITMIAIAMWIFYNHSKNRKVLISRAHWVLMISGTLVILVTYIWDYTLIIFRGGYISDFWNLAYNEAFLNEVTNFEPGRFNWALYIVGEALIVYSIFRFVRRTTGSN